MNFWEVVKECEEYLDEMEGDYELRDLARLAVNLAFFYKPGFVKENKEFVNSRWTHIKNASY